MSDLAAAPATTRTLAPSVSVVLPCLNEAESVGAVVDEARAALEAAGLRGEVLVVDNGSTDGSVELAEKHGARVVREARPGYGAALTCGFRQALGEVIVMADADLTYPLDKLAALVQPLIDGDADLVYGGRLDGLDPKVMPPLHRYVGTPALTFLVARACGGLPLRDSQSGFRAFHRSTILDLDLRSPGMEINSELLLKASQAGLRMKEVPTGYRARVGESKLHTFSDGWRNLRTILLLAPELLLIWPGAALATLGVVMTAAAFVAPSGIPVGSLRWQPVFFSSIALVVGALAAMAGLVVASRSVLVARKVRRRYARLMEPSLLGPVAVAGGVLAACGLGIDVFLLANWAAGNEAPSRGLALASLGQSSIILGAVVACGAGVARLINHSGRAALISLPAGDALSVDRAAS